eukprot:scaffold70042_cov56-Cyclotella_meneghiniana.AAC.1
MVQSFPPPRPRPRPPPPPQRPHPRRRPPPPPSPRNKSRDGSDNPPLPIQKTGTSASSRRTLSHITLIVSLSLVTLFPFLTTYMSWCNAGNTSSTGLIATYSEAPVANKLAIIQQKNKLLAIDKRGGSSLPLPPEYVLNYTGHTTIWDKQSFPCYAGENTFGDSKPIQRGFIYTKPFKSASSTLSGIAIQTAINMAKRMKVQTPHCLVRWNHAQPKEKKYDALIKAESYLWTFLREPTKRTISHFFFDEVSRYKREPHDSLMKKYMMSPGRRYYYFNEFSLTSKYHAKAIPQILDMYDFIGIVERFDESLVVLKLLLGLEYQDILYLSAKSSGGYDDGVSYRKSSSLLGWDGGGKGKGTCVYIVPSFVSPGMKTWLESSTWKNHMSDQNALYAAAYQSLDRTIDKLGKELVAEQLVEFKRRLKIAQEICTNQTVFLCSDAGVRTPNEKSSCLAVDSGCGYDCYNNLTFD